MRHQLGWQHFLQNGLSKQESSKYVGNQHTGEIWVSKLKCPLRLNQTSTQIERETIVHTSR